LPAACTAVPSRKPNQRIGRCIRLPKTFDAPRLFLAPSRPLKIWTLYLKPCCQAYQKRAERAPPLPTSMCLLTYTHASAPLHPALLLATCRACLVCLSLPFPFSLFPSRPPHFVSVQNSRSHFGPLARNHSMSPSLPCSAAQHWLTSLAGASAPRATIHDTRQHPSPNPMPSSTITFPLSPSFLLPQTSPLPRP